MRSAAKTPPMTADRHTHQHQIIIIFNLIRQALTAEY